MQVEFFHPVRGDTCLATVVDAIPPRAVPSLVDGVWSLLSYEPGRGTVLEFLTLPESETP